MWFSSWNVRRVCQRGFLSDCSALDINFVNDDYFKQTNKRKTTSYRSLFLIRIIFWSVNFRGSNWNFICSFFFIAVVHYYYCLVDCFICFLRLSWPTTNWGATGCNQPLNATEKSSSVSFFISVMDLKLISRVDLEPCAVRYIKRCGLSINERKIYQL